MTDTNIWPNSFLFNVCHLSLPKSDFLIKIGVPPSVYLSDYPKKMLYRKNNEYLALKAVMQSVISADYFRVLQISRYEVVFEKDLNMPSSYSNKYNICQFK